MKKILLFAMLSLSVIAFAQPAVIRGAYEASMEYKTAVKRAVMITDINFMFPTLIADYDTAFIKCMTDAAIDSIFDKYPLLFPNEEVDRIKVKNFYRSFRDEPELDDPYEDNRKPGELHNVEIDKAIFVGYVFKEIIELREKEYNKIKNYKKAKIFESKEDEE
jgi:hypothetical protein